MPSVSIPDLLAEVEVPEQGTLSRVVYKDDRIRLVVFAFDTGQELTEHRSSSAAIVQVTKGSIDFSVEDTMHRLTPVSWLYMEPDQPHSLVAREPSVLLLTLLRG
jgi:quercetin dioxygenase-like cupin family protein